MPFHEMDTAVGFGMAPNKLNPHGSDPLCGTSLPPGVDAGVFQEKNDPPANVRTGRCLLCRLVLLSTLLCGVVAAVAGELRIGVGAASWTVAYHPGSTVARVHWWGEKGRGLTLPLDNESPAWATFAVRSTAGKFGAYLRDVSKLQLEIENAQTGEVVGTVEVPVASLSSGVELDEWIPILGFDSKKMGQLRVIAKMTVSVGDTQGGNCRKHNPQHPGLV